MHVCTYGFANTFNDCLVYLGFMLGQAISIRWTVSNVGIGITAANSWSDRIYWSEDQSFGMLHHCYVFGAGL